MPKIPRRNLVRDVGWAYDHLYDEEAKKGDAPTGASWGMLQMARKDSGEEQRFLKMAMKVMAEDKSSKSKKENVNEKKGLSDELAEREEKSLEDIERMLQEIQVGS